MASGQTFDLGLRTLDNTLRSQNPHRSTSLRAGFLAKAREMGHRPGFALGMFIRHIENGDR